MSIVVKSAEQLEAIIRNIGSRIGAYLDDLDVIEEKVIEYIQFAPRPEYPFVTPDGVRYDSPGSVQYPADHQYSKMSAIICELAHESPELQKRIEAATGMYYADLKRE